MNEKAIYGQAKKDSSIEHHVIVRRNQAQQLDGYIS